MYTSWPGGGGEKCTRSFLLLVKFRFPKAILGSIIIVRIA